MEYFHGLAIFMKMNRVFSERIFNSLYGNLNVLYALCIFKIMYLNYLTLMIPGSFKAPALLDAPFKCDEKCPVIVFSHGLGAFRYTHIHTHSKFLCSYLSPWDSPHTVNVNTDVQCVLSGLCIQLYVQNWPLKVSSWHLWNTGNPAYTLIYKALSSNRYMARHDHKSCPTVKEDFALTLVKWTITKGIPFLTAAACSSVQYSRCWERLRQWDRPGHHFSFQ